MDLDERLRATYAERLGEVDLPTGDVAAARREGARLRIRRRLGVGVAAAVVVAVAVGGVLVGTGRVPVGPADETGHWRELPAPPLSPRANAAMVWTGHEVLVVGGEKHPCPPNADCGATDRGLRDAAAYDPATNTWAPIAPAPVPVGPGDRLLAAGGIVVLRHWQQGGSAWFTYEPPPLDRWTRIPDVPRAIGDLPSALGSRVFATAGRRVVVYDVERGDWSTLPADRRSPRLAARRVTATPYGPVVTGIDSTQPNDGRSPSVVLADVFDGKTWRRLPATGQLDNLWTWNGSRMVDADPTVVDGGETDPFPHAYPAGGLLDPATGKWSPLPQALSVDSGEGWGVNAPGRRWFATYGQVYDSQTGSVVRLAQPDGAADQGSAAAWTDDALVVFGGATFGGTTELSNRAWAWTPDPPTP
jgi:hypothetical protein